MLACPGYARLQKDSKSSKAIVHGNSIIQVNHLEHHFVYVCLSVCVCMCPCSFRCVMCACTWRPGVDGANLLSFAPPGFSYF